MKHKYNFIILPAGFYRLLSSSQEPEHFSNLKLRTQAEIKLQMQSGHHDFRDDKDREAVRKPGSASGSGSCAYPLMGDSRYAAQPLWLPARPRCRAAGGTPEALGVVHCASCQVLPISESWTSVFLLHLKGTIIMIFHCSRY